MRQALLIHRTLFVVALAAITPGCNGGVTNPPLFFTGTAAPTPTPIPIPQHLYVGNDDPAGQVNQYTLPLTSGAQSPSLEIIPAAPDRVVALAVDPSGDLAVGLFSGNLLFYNGPVGGASTAAATFPGGRIGNVFPIAFTPAGDFFAGAPGGNAVNMFVHPFKNASMPAKVVTNPAIDFVSGVALDAAQNLYVVSGGASGNGGNLVVYAPPYSGAPIVTARVPGTFYRGAVLTSTQLFVAADPAALGSLGQVDVYDLPIIAASRPAFAITNGVNLPKATAVDAAGNLYVGNSGNSIVAVYAPPFSAASSPTFSVGVAGTGATIVNPRAGAPFVIFSIAIGK